ncbi:uncharacterized protein CBL_13232 [Carabus blaptoides fortunei]
MEDLTIDIQPDGKRWDPLGAPNDLENDEQVIAKHSGDEYLECNHCTYSSERLKSLEEEQEVLNSSLLALTTHFAQVQFRLRQIVNAPVNDKEELLKALEEFAFRGIPDVKLSRTVYEVKDTSVDEKTLMKAMQVKRYQQKELIDQLKYQLRELESYAFETGEAGLPQEVLLERQRVILDELKTKMNLDVDELQPRQMTVDELRDQVNAAVGNIVSPLKMKEHLVNQLKTQVADLERFIHFLQADVESKHCTCHKGRDSRELHDSIHMVKRAATLLQMFAMVQFGCGSGINQFRKNDLKNTMKVSHWGDMRARLQMTVARIVEMGSSDGEDTGNYSSDTEDAPSAVPCNVKLTHTVRKQLAVTLRDLMQHGLTANAGQSVSLVPLMGCFAKKSSYNSHDVHVWDLIMTYYTMKNGEHYNSTPARRLSQSFNLDIVGGSAISNKQSFLSTIGTIISTHTPYKRSNDSHFKAFVCAALNYNKLVAWLKLIYQCKQLVHRYYHPWSYAMQTGFQDTLQCLDVLTPLKFDLPVDLAVRQFQSIKDVFT